MCHHEGGLSLVCTRLRKNGVLTWIKHLFALLLTALVPASYINQEGKGHKYQRWFNIFKLLRFFFLNDRMTTYMAFTETSYKHLKRSDCDTHTFPTTEAPCRLSKWRLCLHLHHFEHFILECLPEKSTGWTLPAFQDTVWTSFLQYSVRLSMSVSATM